MKDYSCPSARRFRINAGLLALASGFLLSASAKAQSAGVNVYFDPSDSHTETAGGGGDFATSDFFNPNTDTDGPFVSGTNGVGTLTFGEGAIFDGPASTVTVSSPVSPDYLEVGVTSGTETFGTSAGGESTITIPIGNAYENGGSSFLNPITVDAGSENVVFNSGINLSIFDQYYNSASVNSASTGNVAFNGGITFTNNTSNSTDPSGNGPGEPNLSLNANASGGTFTINSAVTVVGDTGQNGSQPIQNGNYPIVNFTAANANSTLTLTANASFSGVRVLAENGGTILDQGASFTAPLANTQPILVAGTGQFLTDVAGMTVTAGVQAVGNNEAAGGYVGSALAAETTYSGLVVGYNGGNFNLTSAAGGRVDFTGDVVNGNGYSITKVGAGVVNLDDTGSQSENQQGTFIIQNGTLLYNTALSNTGATSSGLTINNVATSSLVANSQTYATLGGVGNLSAPVTAAGQNSQISPGDMTGAGVRSIGTLTLSGGLTANSGLTMNFQLNGSAAHAYDVLNFAGSAFTASGNVILNFTDVGGPLDTNTDYDIITGIGGEDFDSANFTLNAPAGYTADYTIDGSASQGNEYIAVDFTAAPEPSTWALMLGALGFLVMVRRFRGSQV